MTTCPDCQRSATSTYSGTYDLSCTSCCARLVRNARPNKALQEAQFAAIARLPNAPMREEILEELRK